jgi:hypothetical protein
MVFQNLKESNVLNNLRLLPDFLAVKCACLARSKSCFERSRDKWADKDNDRQQTLCDSQQTIIYK